MVTTAMFARGIDIADVTQIINYDMPSTQHGGIEEFIHRIGRTARMGNTGHAISFMTDRNDDIAPDLVELLMEVGQDIPPFLTSYLPEGADGVIEAVGGDIDNQIGESATGDIWSSEEKAGFFEAAGGEAASAW
jgi:ATP-dependent RNA helicase DDX3X